MNEQAKQKAAELIERFLPSVRGADRYNYNLESMNVFIAKQCAIICCDEIFKTGYLEGTTLGVNKKFWQSVKSEIEKY